MLQRATPFLLTALFSSALASSCSNSEVSYTLIMTDSYGDGWTGASWSGLGQEGKPSRQFELISLGGLFSPGSEVGVFSTWAGRPRWLPHHPRD